MRRLNFSELNGSPVIIIVRNDLFEGTDIAGLIQELRLAQRGCFAGDA